METVKTTRDIVPEIVTVHDEALKCEYEKSLQRLLYSDDHLKRYIGSYDTKDAEHFIYSLCTTEAACELQSTFG